ncbi:RNA polymerase factor sigma-32 [Haliangium sp.]|uniref:RNA polymerase factor sigma-32 n=1 Tax=Haliangium sp. TaxID=2663208 RepID=UPI003D148E4C
MAGSRKAKSKQSGRRRRKANAERDEELAASDDGAGHDDAGHDDEDDGEGGDDDDEVLVGELIDGPGSGGDGDDSDVSDDADLDRLVTGPTGRGQQKSTSRVGLIKRDPLSAYIQETKRYGLLSREEEHELAIKLVEDGDPGAARKLIESNLRLVVKIAYEYRRAYRNLLDLIQEGNIGLMQAVRKYDPYRGVKLSSYAAWWIRAYILKFILNNWRLVKIGTTQAQRKLFFNLRKEKERLEQLGFSPTPALLAENLDVAEKDVVEMEKRLAAPDASLDAPVQSDEEGTRTRMDYLPGEDGHRPDLQVAHSQFHELLREKLEAFADTLEGREETIFRERWLTDSPLTLQQIGDQYGVSRERARQLEKRLLTRLRKHLEREFGTAVDIDALSRE